MFGYDRYYWGDDILVLVLTNVLNALEVWPEFTTIVLADHGDGDPDETGNADQEWDQLGWSLKAEGPNGAGVGEGVLNADDEANDGQEDKDGDGAKGVLVALLLEESESWFLLHSAEEDQE